MKKSNWVFKLPRKKKKAFKIWFANLEGFTVAPDKEITPEGIFKDLYSMFRSQNCAKVVMTTKGR